MSKQKTIVFLTRYFWPHIGGVEKQVMELSRRLVKKGHKVTVVTTRHEGGLKKTDIKEGVKIIRLTPLPIKYLGLLSIWVWMIGHINLFKKTDVIHAHSVFIWYWPLKLLMPRKPVYVTFHGWEGIYPIPKKNIWIRKIDAFLATKSMAIHNYVEKYYGVKATKIIYPAVNLPRQKKIGKDYKRLVYVGRLDEDTGLRQILAAVKALENIQIDWCGDGLLRNECRKVGVVHGWVNPEPFYKRSFICLSAGVTAIMEAMSYRCLIVTTYNNPVKKDYLLMTPFRNWIVAKQTGKKLIRVIKKYLVKPELAREKINDAYNWVKTQGWDNMVKVYEQMWRQ